MTSLRIVAALLLAQSLPPFSAGAAEYHVTGDQQFTSASPHPTVFSVKATSDRGYLILGNSGSRELRLLKVSEKGEKQWEKNFAARSKANNQPTFAIEAEDGGFWIVGRVSEFEFISDIDIDAIFLKDRRRFQSFPEIPFISKIDATGKLEWRNPIGMLEGFRSSQFVCGVKTKDGLILVGRKTHTYKDQPPPLRSRNIAHPWIVKVDLKGNPVWEVAVPGGLHETLSATLINTRQCGGPYLNADGSIVVGMEVYWYPTYEKDGVRIVTGPGTGDKGAHSYLIMRLDAHGKQLEQTVLRNQHPGVLLKDGDAFWAITNPVPASRNGILRTWLNSNLSILKTEETKFPGYSIVLHGASIGPRKGVHLVGAFESHDERAVGWAIAHLTSSGDLVGIKPLVSRSPSWNLEGQTWNRGSEEFAVVLRRNSEVRLVQFKYKHKE